jgi:hypothetical protein
MSSCAALFAASVSAVSCATQRAPSSPVPATSASAAYCPTEHLAWLATSPLYELDSLGEPTYEGWHERVASALWGLPLTVTEDPDALRTYLDSLRVIDSVALKWSLADLIADDVHYPNALAATAVASYSALGFDGHPLLARAQVQGTGPARWRFVLAPLQAPLSADAERVVTGFACRAIPLLTAAEAGKAAPMFPWFTQYVGEGLEETVRLLPEPARADVIRALIAHGDTSYER